MNRIGYMLIVMVLLFASFSGGCGNKGGKLTEIRITPQSGTIATGTSVHYSAVAIFGDGTIVNWTSATSWSTSDENAVTISNQFDTFGLAQSIRSAVGGAVTITGTDTANNISSTVTLSVTDPLSLSIFPPSAFMAVSTGHAFRADALLSSDPSVPTQDLTSLSTWTTSNPAVATVSAAGIVTTLATGTTMLSSTYTFTGLSGPVPTTGATMITVTDTALESLTLTSNPSITSSVISVATGTVQFGATGNYKSNTVQIPFTESVSWSSSNQAVATIMDKPGSKGTCTLVAAGSTVITAIDPISGVSAAATMVVQ